MSIRKQWMRFALIVSLLGIVINTGVLIYLVNNNFSSYLVSQYEMHVEKVVSYTQRALVDGTSISSMRAELITHINDPITAIRVYDPQGRLIIGIAQRDEMHDMMRPSSSNTFTETKELTYNNQRIGSIKITAVKAVQEFLAAKDFTRSLLGYSLLSLLLVLAIAVVVASLMSRKSLQDLTRTSAYASALKNGTNPSLTTSKFAEIATIQTTLKQLHDQLRFKQRTRKQLLDELVHQTRTPLTIMKAHLEGIQDGYIEWDAKEVSIFVNQVDMVSATIANLSKLLESQQEVMPLEWTTFEMQDVLNQLVNGLQMSFEKQNVTLALQAQSCVIESDSYRIAQILYNLLTNALKFSAAGQSVQVIGQRAHDSYQISVKDNGIGMSEATLQQLFEPYFQAHPDTYPGEGIGLYVVKQYVSQLHGTIEVQSTPQRGTTFILHLPLQKPH